MSKEKYSKEEIQKAFDEIIKQMDEKDYKNIDIEKYLK